MKPNYLLTLNQLELSLYLGWPDDERLRKQTVLLDIDIYPPDAPKACTTDQLEDTYCYRQLIESLRNNFGDEKFHLIEHVTMEIHRFLTSCLPPQTAIKVRLTKRPQIDGLGSVTFHYGDDI